MGAGSEENNPSEAFMDAVCDAGTYSMDCQFCGRTHFNDDDERVDELLEKEKKEPDKYRHTNEGISFGTIDGKQYVYGCPCGKIGRYERWILDHRELISRFLKKWAALQAQKAKEAESLTQGI